MTKQSLIDYYENLHNHYSNYHNHKEISAWAGLSMHVLFCGLILNVTVPDNNRIITLIGLTIIVILVAVIAFLHVKNQLTLKDKGRALHVAANSILTEILLKSESDLNPQEYLKPASNTDREFSSSSHITKRLHDEAVTLNKKGIGRSHARRNSVTTYCLWSLSTIATIVIKWSMLLDQF